MKNFLYIALIVSMVFSYNVILDPGHGGSDPGAVGPSYEEQAANLDVAEYARDYLEDVSVDVGFTRTGDYYVSLADRCAIANAGGYERFMSQHENAYDATVQGTETYCYSSGSSNSFDLRNCVQPELIWAHGYYDRGTKTASYYVLVNTSMPAILGEGTFIDYNVDWDESWRYLTNWNDHEGRQGYAYAKGYCIHRGITPPVYGDDPSVDTMYIDDGDPEFTISGSWNITTGSGWESDYRWNSTTFEGDWARWTPDFTDAGEWEVAIYYRDGTNRCTESVFIVHHSAGADTYLVDQSIGGYTWQVLGTFDFNAGTSGYIELSDVGTPSSQVVIADAVRLINTGTLPIMDNNLLKPDNMEISVYPNPFNSTCRISLTNPSSYNCCGGIYTIKGKKVRDFEINKGNTAFIWNGTNQSGERVNSGIYFYRLKINGNRHSGSIILLK